MSSAKLLVDQTTDIDDINLSKVQDISTIAKQELDHFDTTYEDDITEKYEQIRNEMLAETEVSTPQIEKVDNEFFPAIRLKNEVEAKSENVVSINLRGKLIIGVFTSILLLLSILLVYNAVLINRYRAEVGTDSQIVADLQDQNAILEGELNGLLNGVDAGSLNMGEGTYQDIPLIQRTPVSEIPGETNWFDAICNFFSSLFGG